MEPIATFYRVADSAVMPMRADRGALGTLPTAAFQYCEAVTSASAFGWYAFPPINFHVQWDGAEFIWTDNDSADWFPLSSTHLPGFDGDFDRVAPAAVRGLAPPFLTAVPQPGVLQIWTGVLLRTRPGWSALVRPPANVARSRHYELYEGIIETDKMFYPLFINMRILSVDRPISFDRHKPLLQIQPLIRETYGDASLQSATFIDGLQALTEKDWCDLQTSLSPRATNPLLAPGRYARDVRKRQSEAADQSSDSA